MQNTDIDLRLDRFERDFDAARPAERVVIHAQLQQVIRNLKVQCLPVPGPLLRIEKKLEQDLFEDMFDNMPV